MTIIVKETREIETTSKFNKLRTLPFTNASMKLSGLSISEKKILIVLL